MGGRPEPEPQSRLCSDTRGRQAVRALSFLSSGTLRLAPTALAALSRSTRSGATSPLPSPWPLGAGPVASFPASVSSLGNYLRPGEAAPDSGYGGGLGTPQAPPPLCPAWAW